MFEELIKKDPSPGVKNRLSKSEDGKFFLIPNWITGTNESDGFYRVPTSGTKKFYKEYNLTNKILYDVLVLGLKSIEDRPKCPICGKELGFRNNLLGKFSGYNNKCSLNCHLDSIRPLAVSGDALKRSVETRKRNGAYDHLYGNTYRKDTPTTEETRRRISEANKGRKLSKETIKKQSESKIKFFKEHPDKLKKFLNSPKGKNKRGVLQIVKSPTKEFHYLSSWEMRFVKFLDDEIQEIIEIKSPNSIEYLFKNSIHNYFPDIEITFNNGKKLLIEIKPRYYLTNRKNKAKFKAGKEFVSNNSDLYIDFIVLTQDDLFIDSKYSDLKKIDLKTKLLSYINQ